MGVQNLRGGGGALAEKIRSLFDYLHEKQKQQVEYETSPH